MAAVPVVVILTESEYARIDPQTPNHTKVEKLVLGEEQWLEAELNRRGVPAKRVGWDDKTFDWSRPSLLVIRCIWDYAKRYSEFCEWVERVKPVTAGKFLNDLNLVQWNIDKHYLKELSDRGVKGFPTVYLEPGTLQKEKLTFAEWFHANISWSDVVTKPCVSGNSKDTFHFVKEDVGKYSELYTKLNEKEALMVQPFQHGIKDGEISVFVLDGKVTHSVRKVPQPNDFRIQFDFGGIDSPHEPTAEEREFALRVIQACPGDLLIARVDFFRDNDGDLALVELEIIEPRLWMELCPEAVGVLADGIERRLGLLAKASSS
jgi:hypothetical protein